MRISLLGGQKTVYTDYSSRTVLYWDEYFYNTSESNAIYREYEELTYEGSDTIIVGQRQLEFVGLYFNATTGRWEEKPYKAPSGTGTPRGALDEPIIIGNGELLTGNGESTANTNSTTFFGGLTERANGNSQTTKQINPYLEAYTGKNTADRIAYLKAALRWLEVEIKSVQTQLERDLRLLKNSSINKDEREIKIIEAAGMVLSTTKALKIPGLILSGAAQLGKLFNKSNASKVTLTESVRSKTELLNQYISDYQKLKVEYDNLVENGGSSDSGLSAGKQQLYWIGGIVIVAGIVVYFLVRNK